MTYFDGYLAPWLLSFGLLAFLSAMEIAFLSSDKLQFAVNKKDKGPYNYMLNFLYSHPRQFMGALSCGNLIALVGFVYFLWCIFVPMMHDYSVLPSFIIYVCLIIGLFIILFFVGEFIPRLLFMKRANFWVRVFAIPAFILFVFFYPISKAFVIVSRAVLSVFGIKSAKTEDKLLGRVDLDSYVKKEFEEINDEDELDSEVKIFKNALEFSSMKLRDCMVPRADIVAVDENISVDALKEKFIETGLSRILVYRDNIDDIIGYIHIWELFGINTDWKSHVAPISFVPDSMGTNQMMSELMQQRRSIAVVVDEFGSTSGIITMEDLVEEIFGDIEDEYDTQSQFVKKENDNEYVLSGRVELDDLNENYGLDIPESDDYTTVAGFLLHHTQRFPKTYETVVIGNYTFKILKVTARKIEVVRLIIDPSE